MKTKNYTFVVLLLALLFGGYTSANAAEKTSGLILNEDASHFFFQRPAEKMTIEGLHELVDKYSDGQVSHLFFNVNGMKTSYRSEPLGLRVLFFALISSLRQDHYFFLQVQQYTGRDSRPQE